MLAARDQENLVHGHQAAAAAKPLNQGTKQFAPKTPGNKVPKTPFKVPLNDENGGLGGGKTALRTNGKGNENFVLGTKKGGLGDKNAFVTPIAPRARAPLGVKTTNAKAKAFQTPAPLPVKDNGDKASQKSVSARKPKPRVSHAEMTKVEIVGDKDELEERDIEYMPPRGEDMPDLPDDHFEIDTKFFEKHGGILKGAFGYYQNKKGPDGLSYREREEKRQEERWAIDARKFEAKSLRDIEGTWVECCCEPECPGDVCKYVVEARKRAEEQYQKRMAEIEAETNPKPKKKTQPANGPSTLQSKSAATALSQTKNAAAAAPKASSKAPLQPAKSRLNTSLASGAKKTPAPTNPSSMRHNAAVANSKTTMGYAKGRSTSATLRTTVLPKKEPERPDTSLAPAVYIQKYGVPEIGSRMWFTCKDAGCFDEDEDPSLDEIGEDALDRLIREEAEQDFQLVL
ncbi:hypothetical protein ACLMJK_005772 [Lecanora helva]